MPASLPGSTASQNAANPSVGRAVMFDALSGPKGAPFDKDTAPNCSTGGMCTGIGFSPLSIIRPSAETVPATAAQAIKDAGFTDDAGPAALSSHVYIGGGKSTAAVSGFAPTVPYVAGYKPCAAGNGASRDSGTAGFPVKMVTATGNVANGAAIEAGFVNRSNVAMIAGDSAFGIATVVNAAPS